MDLDVSYSSDSTHCSFYDNSTETKNGLPHESELLDETHKKILLHWEGKKLIAKCEALQYMKQISKMGVDTYKDRYFAEKIQSSLLKIIVLETKFEKSLSQNQLEMLSDPIKYCSTEDFKEAHEDDKKGLFTNSDVEKSFPVDLLTNNNFVSFEKCIDDKRSAFNEICKTKEIIGSEELFTSQKGTVHMENSSQFYRQSKVSQRFSHSSNVFYSDEIIPLKRQCIEDISKEIITDEICLPQNSLKCIQDKEKYYKKLDNGIQNKDDYKESTTNYGIYKTAVNKDDRNTKLNIISMETGNEMCNMNTKLSSDMCGVSCNESFNVLSKIMNIEDTKQHSSLKSENIFADTGISVDLFSEEEPSFKCLSRGLKVTDVKHLIQLDISEAIDGGWHKTQKDLERKGSIATTVNNTLTQLFEKLSIDKHQSIEKEFMNMRVYKRGDFHQFALEDERKLDVENLFLQNKVRLEAISAEFKKKNQINKINSNYEVLYCDSDSEISSYKELDWQTLLL